MWFPACFPSGEDAFANDLVFLAATISRAAVSLLLERAVVGFGHGCRCGCLFVLLIWEVVLAGAVVWSMKKKNWFQGGIIKS